MGQRPRRDLPAIAAPAPVLITWALCWLAFAAMVLVGFGLFVTGCGQQQDVDSFDPFHVVFTQVGDDCTDDDFVLVYFDTTDGDALQCGNQVLIGGIGIPAFGQAKADQVLDLAKRLGKDGLSASDEAQIQQEVDRIGQALPRSQWPSTATYSGFWGAGMAWTGAGILVLAILFVWLGRPRLIAAARRRVSAGAGGGEPGESG